MEFFSDLMLGNRPSKKAYVLTPTSPKSFIFTSKCPTIGKGKQAYPKEQKFNLAYLFFAHNSLKKNFTYKILLYGDDFNPEEQIPKLGWRQRSQIYNSPCHALTRGWISTDLSWLWHRALTPFPVTGRVRWQEVTWQEMLAFKWGLKFHTFDLVDTFLKKLSARQREVLVKECSLRNARLCRLQSRQEHQAADVEKAWGSGQNLELTDKIPSENLKEKPCNNR